MNLQKNVLLRNYSNYKIGGPAKFFVEVSSVDQLKEVLNNFKNEKKYVIGAGTKLLIADKGFDGLIIHNKIEGIERIGNNLRIGSGVLVKRVVDYFLDNSLSGLEWAGGLPGTIGGAVRGNAGSFGGETKDNVLEVESINLETLQETTRTNAECGFDYRNSIFKSSTDNSEFITYVTLKLTPGDSQKIKEGIQERIDYRNLKQPLEYPSIGSTFKNIPVTSLSEELKKQFSEIIKNDPFPVVPVTKLLALAGLKGRRVGGAMISDKQPNFIVNIDNATSEDVKALVEIAKKTIREKYSIEIKEEIVRLN